MTEAITVNIVTPISSVNMVDGLSGAIVEPDEASVLMAEMEQEKAKMILTSQALEQAVAGFKQAQEDIFGQHREQIVNLSVQIAEKILLQEIGSGNYDITKIIEKALKKSPSKQNIVIHVNDGDLETFNRTIKEGNTSFDSSIEFIADANIGPGECVVKTDKGIIEHLIDSHLSQIAEALKRTE